MEPWISFFLKPAIFAGHPSLCTKALLGSRRIGVGTALVPSYAMRGSQKRVLAQILLIALSLLVPLQSFAEDPAEVNRWALVDCLRKLAARAQNCYHTRGIDGGMDGSFQIITLSQLVDYPENAYGYFVLSSPGNESFDLTGVGREIGRDGINPIEVEITVYADSVFLWHNN